MNWRQVLSLLLVLVFAVQLVPLQAFAEVSDDSQELQSTGDVVIATEPDEPAVIVGEVESERGETVKHYRLSDGSFAAVQYAEPVHYMTSDGQWEDIDNSLTLKDGFYTAQAGDVSRRFPEELGSGQLFEMAYSDYSVSMSSVSLTGGDTTQDGELSVALPGAGGAVSVVLSAAESITTDLSNKESTGTIVADAIISASFGAVSGFADDFISTREATTGVRNVIQSISKTTRGNHPKVKKAANKLIGRFKRKAGRSLLSSLLWGVSTT